MNNKIAIVTDSSISFSKEEIEQYEVYVLPSIITYDNQTYLDQVTINNKEVNELLRKNKTVTTSQPNIGQIVEIFESIKEKSYDHIFILTVSKHISGGYNSFYQAAQMAKIKNYSLIDTFSAAGPAQQGVRTIRSMNETGTSIDKILIFLEFLFANQVTYIIPKSLKYIAKSGRISKTIADITSLFSIRTALYLKQQGVAVEKLGIARTDKRIYNRVIKHFRENRVTPEHYDLYLSENDAADKVKQFKEYLFEEMGIFDYHMIQLPAVLSTHTGPGTLGIQWCPKLPN